MHGFEADQTFETGERVGLCAFVSQSSTAAEAVESTLAQLIRVEISNPPAFGARIVAAVLEDESIAAEWGRNLITMSSRIAEMRWQLFKELDRLGECFPFMLNVVHTILEIINISFLLKGTPGNWERITRQKGMFCILGLTPPQVSLLQGEWTEIRPFCSVKVSNLLLTL
jgi:aspartate aminotransferase